MNLKHKTVSLFYTLILLQTGCTSSDKLTAYNGELISRTNVTQRTIEQLDSLIVSYDFIPLETGDNSLLSNITDIRYHDRKFSLPHRVSDLHPKFSFSIVWENT